MHPNAPERGQLGPDLAVLKLERAPANAKPLQLATAPPAIGSRVTLFSYGRPGNLWGDLPESGELLGGNAPLKSVTSTGYLTTEFRESFSPEPFNIGANNGSSGGGLVDAQGSLNGIMSLITRVTSSQNTYSINITLPGNSEFITKAIEDFSGAGQPLPPHLEVAQTDPDQVDLVATNAPLRPSQAGGTWKLQRADAAMQSWETLGTEIQADLQADGRVRIPVQSPAGVFRLGWFPD